jgi:nitroreductase
VQFGIEPYAQRWYSVISKRRSRRQFDPTQPVDLGLLENLRRFCEKFRPFPDARAVLVSESPNTVFKGAIGPFGKVKDAPAFVAFIGNTQGPSVQEAVGYTGEGVVLETTASQLGTCWVGGFFRPEVAARLAGIQEDESVLAVTPIGYVRKNESLEEKLMTGFGRTHKRHPLSHLTTGLSERDWPEWVRVSLEAARFAPSAVNRQPWGFHVERDSVVVSVRTMEPGFQISKRLDCGIAMLHIELGALSCGLRGKWDILEQPKVARMTIAGTV